MKKFIPLWTQKLFNTKKALLWTAALSGAVFLILIVGLVYFVIPSQTSSDDDILHTSLFALKIKKIPFNNVLSKLNLDRHVRWGSITKVGKDVLVQRDHRFFHLALETSTLTQLNIAPPDNGVQQLHNHLGLRRFFKTSLPRIKTHHLGYPSTFVIQRPNRQIMLISYAYWNAQNHCFSLRIARTDMPAAQHPTQWKIKAEDWKVIFETQPCISLADHQFHFRGNQSGGRIILSPRPNHILLTVGDFGSNGRQQVDDAILQNANSDYGRILEININNGRKTNISIGHRNPQGIAFDAQKRLWSTEHGPQGGDEVNLIVKGKNYGWPFVTYGTQYGLFVWPLSKQQGQHEIYQKPFYAFVPSIGISNITLVENFAAEWDGDLLVASLKAQTLYRLRIVQSRVVVVEPIRLGHRIRYIYNHGNGTLIALDDKNFIHIIKRKKKSIEKLKIIRISAPQNIARAAQAEWDQCLVCHGSGTHSNKSAPTLYGVVGRTIGESDFVNYSQSFKSSNDRWTQARLRAFLRNSDDLFEDSSMPNPNINDPRIIDAIIEHLKTLTD